MNKVSDETIIQKVNKQLSNRGMQSPCHIAVTSRKGDVTLSGMIQYEHQRIAALHATRGIDGVRRVMDHLQVQPKTVQKLLPKKISPEVEKTAPTSEKTTPVDQTVTCIVGNRDNPSNPT